MWQRIAGADEAPLRVLPDGCIDLIWLGGRLVVAGPDTGAYLSSLPPGVEVTGLRFAPGIGPTVLGVAADVLRDQRIDLDAIWSGRDVRRLADETAESAQRGVALEAAAARRLAIVGGPPQELLRVAARLRGGDRVDVAASAAGLSPRHLRRLAPAAFGYGAKMLARVLRLRRALALAGEAGANRTAEVAARAGYADQAHLARDVRALAGTTWGDLTRS